MLSYWTIMYPVLSLVHESVKVDNKRLEREGLGEQVRISNTIYDKLFYTGRKDKGYLI